MTLNITTSINIQEWDAYVSADQNANPYHLYGWNDIFRETFFCETCYLTAEAEGKIRGVLPLFIIKHTILGGNYISSLPGGVCADEVTTAQQLLQAAIELTRQRGMRYLKLRDETQPWRDDRLKTEVEYTHVLDNLPSDPAVVWERPQANKFRRAVRRARREGLVAVWDNKHLDAFYHVYANNMRDLGTPAIPKPFFKKTVEQFPDKVRILTVNQGGQIVGGMYLFAFNNVLHNMFVSSLRQYFHLHPNDLLYWEAIAYACNHGYRTFDMGRSILNSGNARFKEKFLAKPRELFYQYYLNTAKAVPASRGGKAYQMVKPVWKRLPTSIANGLGLIIRRTIPLG